MAKSTKQIKKTTPVKEVPAAKKTAAKKTEEIKSNVKTIEK